jgi:hypothetical protein
MQRIIIFSLVSDQLAIIGIKYKISSFVHFEHSTQFEQEAFDNRKHLNRLLNIILANI